MTGQHPRQSVKTIPPGSAIVAVARGGQSGRTIPPGSAIVAVARGVQRDKIIPPWKCHRSRCQGGATPVKKAAIYQGKAIVATSQGGAIQNGNLPPPGRDMVSRRQGGGEESTNAPGRDMVSRFRRKNEDADIPGKAIVATARKI